LKPEFAKRWTPEFCRLPTVDVAVVLIDGSYHDVDSNEMAFKIAGSMAYKKQEHARQLHHRNAQERGRSIRFDGEDIGGHAAHKRIRSARAQLSDPSLRQHERARQPVRTAGLRRPQARETRARRIVEEAMRILGRWVSPDGLARCRRSHPGDMRSSSSRGHGGEAEAPYFRRSDGGALGSEVDDPDVALRLKSRASRSS